MPDDCRKQRLRASSTGAVDELRRLALHRLEFGADAVARFPYVVPDQPRRGFPVAGRDGIEDGLVLAPHFLGEARPLQDFSQ